MKGSCWELDPASTSAFCLGGTCSCCMSLLRMGAPGLASSGVALGTPGCCRVGPLPALASCPGAPIWCISFSRRAVRDAAASSPEAPSACLTAPVGGCCSCCFKLAVRNRLSMGFSLWLWAAACALVSGAGCGGAGAAGGTCRGHYRMRVTVASIHTSRMCLSGTHVLLQRESCVLCLMGVPCLPPFPALITKGYAHVRPTCHPNRSRSMELCQERMCGSGRCWHEEVSKAQLQKSAFTALIRFGPPAAGAALAHNQPLQYVCPCLTDVLGIGASSMLCIHAWRLDTGMSMQGCCHTHQPACPRRHHHQLQHHQRQPCPPATNKCTGRECSGQGQG